jgi:hypothetical protein
MGEEGRRVSCQEVHYPPPFGRTEVVIVKSSLFRETKEYTFSILGLVSYVYYP